MRHKTTVSLDDTIFPEFREHAKGGERWSERRESHRVHSNLLQKVTIWLPCLPVWAIIPATFIHHIGLYPAHTAHACTCMHIATQGTFLQTQHRRRGTQSNAPLRPKDVNGAQTDSRPPELLSLPARWNETTRKYKRSWEELFTALGGSLRMIYPLNWLTAAANKSKIFRPTTWL